MPLRLCLSLYVSGISIRIWYVRRQLVQLIEVVKRLFDRCYPRAVFMLFGSVAQTGLPRAEVLVKPSTSVGSSDPISSDGEGGMSPLPIIGGAVGSVALIAAACWCWLRRRRRLRRGTVYGRAAYDHNDVEV